MPPQRKPTPTAQTRALLAAVTKGDVGGVTSLIAQNYPDSLTRISAMENACLAPNAIALLHAFGLHNRPPTTTFTSHCILGLFTHACRHGADPSTVVHIIRTMRQLLHTSTIYRQLWDGLSLAIQRKSAVLVACILEGVGDFLHHAHDKFLTKVIESADKEFALAVAHSSGVQAFLLDMEKTFEPALVAEPRPRKRGRSSRTRPPRVWVTSAFKSGAMCDVVELIYQLCPLMVGESVFLYGHRNPATTRTRASWAPAIDRYSVFNDKIKAILDAVQAGNVQAVAATLEEASTLVNARDANGVPALTLSSTSSNGPALLACFRQHLHKHDRGKINTPATVYWHVCENGGDSTTLAFLVDWLGECASMSSDALWDGVKQALAKQHLPMFTHLLQVGRKTGAMDFNKLLWYVMMSNVHDFPVAMFESQPMQVYLGTLDPVGYDEDVKAWVAYGVHCDLPRLVDCMDKWSPDATRKAMFVYCVHSRLDSPKWRKFSRRHESDVKWSRVRDSHLVQCRRLPGVHALGKAIAEFVEKAFDPKDEFMALYHGRTDLASRIRTVVCAVRTGQYRSDFLTLVAGVQERERQMKCYGG